MANKNLVSVDLQNFTTEFGNRQVTAHWKDEDLWKDLLTIKDDVLTLESDLRDCVNELCLKCGQYRTQHLGSCDGCRWKRVKEEVRK